jgi:hypothetical protein
LIGDSSGIHNTCLFCRSRDTNSYNFVNSAVFYIPYQRVQIPVFLLSIHYFVHISTAIHTLPLMLFTGIMYPDNSTKTKSKQS